MSQPYFLFVTGSFVPPPFYDDLVEKVRAQGHDIKVLHLPTVGSAPGKPGITPAPTMYDDAALVAKEAKALADAGREVILVAHSYGGFPATESIKGLSVEARKKEGKKGGIVRIAYQTALVAKPGRKAGEVLPPPEEGAPRSQTDENGWLYVGDPERGAKTCFSDLPREEGLRRHAQFAMHSGVSFTNPLTYPGYKDVPVSYFLCEDDLVVSPEIQRGEIEMIEAETGRKVDVTSVKAGHCPHTSVPEKVVDWFRHLALL
ncbi:Alpha/beta hydrolase fold-1 [Xylaria grammica]|nr:Alpha/beta hydrolase fold-1 [Xylaria grammica]